MFCGATANLDREHLWPDWLNKYRDDATGEQMTVIQSLRGEEEKAWPIKTLNLRYRGVCENCNSGWMSEIESAAERLIGTMFSGRSIELTPADQLDLARWTVLKAIVFEARRRPSVHTPASRREFFRTRLPPPTTRVRATAYKGDETLDYLYGTAVMGRWSDKTITRMYCSTFLIGKVVLQAFGAPIPDDGTLESLGVPRKVYVPLFPISIGTLRWPPPLVVDDEGLRRFHRRAFPE